MHLEPHRELAVAQSLGSKRLVDLVLPHAIGPHLGDQGITFPEQAEQEIDLMVEQHGAGVVFPYSTAVLVNFYVLPHSVALLAKFCNMQQLASATRNTVYTPVLRLLQQHSHRVANVLHVCCVLHVLFCKFIAPPSRRKLQPAKIYKYRVGRPT